jgi:signal transduction histidine kinase
MRSAKNTSAELPKLKRRIRHDSASLKILERIEQEVNTSLTAQSRLIPFAGRRKFTTINLIAVLDLVSARYKAAYKKIKLQMSIRSNEFLIDGNEDYAAYVIDNLFRNSIDAMPTGGVISVEEVDSNDPNQISLLFSDDGHGIRPEIKDSIWEPYFSDDGQGKQKGLGLGLWLVRDLVQRMNGELMLVDSTPFCKTTFILMFSRITADEVVR